VIDRVQTGGGVGGTAGAGLSGIFVSVDADPLLAGSTAAFTAAAALAGAAKLSGGLGACGTLADAFLSVVGSDAV